MTFDAKDHSQIRWAVVDRVHYPSDRPRVAKCQREAIAASLSTTSEDYIDVTCPGLLSKMLETASNSVR
jgi:hypothetical protein